MPKLHRWLKRVRVALTRSSSRARSSSLKTDTSVSTSSSSSRSTGNNITVSSNPNSRDQYASSEEHLDEIIQVSKQNKSSKKQKQPPSPSSEQQILPNVKKVETTKDWNLLEDEKVLDGISKWENAVVVLVGACAGIGSSICISLVRRGFTVIGCSKTKELVNAMAEECTERQFKGQLYSYKSELLYENDVKNLFDWVYKKFGRIDILINNPELINDSSLKALSSDNLKIVVQKKISTLILCTKEAASYMIRQKNGRGHIFNICSTFDLIAAEYMRIMSSTSPATKRASKGLRLESVEESKITVNGISPGKSEADLFRRIYGQRYVDQSPFTTDDYFTPQEVANTLLYSLAALANT